MAPRPLQRHQRKGPPDIMTEPVNDVLEATLQLVKALRDHVYDLGGQFDEIVRQLDSLSDAATDAREAARGRHPGTWREGPPALTVVHSGYTHREDWEDGLGEDARRGDA